MFIKNDIEIMDKIAIDYPFLSKYEMVI